MYAKRTVRIFFQLLLITICASSMRAQVQLGENTNLSANGSLGFGYSGGYGDYYGSTHGLSFTGLGNVSGYYYNPNFLSFNLQPYYNRSQSNSSSLSIFNDRGLNSTVGLFTGSHFPGSVSYNVEKNSDGQFGLPDVAGLATEGDSRSLNLSWGILKPNLPTLQTSFTTSTNSSTVLGQASNYDTHWKNLNMYSNYLLSGFQLNAYLNRQTMDIAMPEFLGTTTSTDTASTTYGLSAMHKLPLSGSFGTSYSRTNYNSESTGYNNNGTVDNADANVTVVPTAKLTLSSNVRYTGNLIGAVQQTIISSGGAPLAPADATSSSLDYSGYATYAIFRGIQIQGNVTHRDQHYLGQDISQTLFGGNVNFNYSKPLFGMLYVNFGMVENVSQDGNEGLGFIGNAGMRKKIHGWEGTADFSYSQNVETLIAVYTTSSYNYGASMRRKFNSDTYWSGSFRAAHSGLTQQEGFSNRSESVTTNFVWHRYSVTGTYSQGYGATVLTASGLLTPAPLPGLPFDNFVYYNAHSYGYGAGVSPIRKLTITGNFTKVTSSTQGQSLYSLNDSTRYYATLEYRLRKLFVRGNFSHVQQNISAAGTAPANINSYYITISRWFNIF